MQPNDQPKATSDFKKQVSFLSLPRSEDWVGKCLNDDLTRSWLHWNFSFLQVDTPKPDVLREKVVVVENVRDTQCSLSWPRRSLQQHLLNVEKHGVEVMVQNAFFLVILNKYFVIE